MKPRRQWRGAEASRLPLLLPSVAEGHRSSDRSRIRMKATDSGASGCRIEKAERSTEELVQVAQLILLVQQVVAEHGKRPSARSIDARPSSQQRIAGDDGLRVRVVLQAAILLRHERQV